MAGQFLCRRAPLSRPRSRYPGSPHFGVQSCNSRGGRFVAWAFAWNAALPLMARRIVEAARRFANQIWKCAQNPVEGAMANSRFEFEVLIIGAGPAGLAAASVAAESGSRVAVLDDTPWLGRQIW